MAKIIVYQRRLSLPTPRWGWVTIQPKTVVQAGEVDGMLDAIAVEDDERGLAAGGAREAVEFVGVVDDEAVLHVSGL